MPLLSRRSAADLAPAVPCLGRWASLRFAFDPDGFLAAGRPLGEGSFYEPWAFRLDGRRVAVVGTREAADVVLQGPTRFYRGTVDREDDCALAPLLGRTSPLLDLVPRVEAAAQAGPGRPRRRPRGGPRPLVAAGARRAPREPRRPGRRGRARARVVAGAATLRACPPPAPAR